jgi:hypothetical protein
LWTLVRRPDNLPARTDTAPDRRRTTTPIARQ